MSHFSFRLGTYDAIFSCAWCDILQSLLNLISHLIFGLAVSRKAKQNEVKVKQLAAGKVKKQLEEGKAEFEELKQKESALRADVSSARSKFEESKAASMASSSQNSVLKALMDATATGKIPGIYGTCFLQRARRVGMQLKGSQSKCLQINTQVLAGMSYLSRW